jgi:hypothetical protein
MVLQSGSLLSLATGVLVSVGDGRVGVCSWQRLSCDVKRQCYAFVNTTDLIPFC